MELYNGLLAWVRTMYRRKNLGALTYNFKLWSDDKDNNWRIDRFVTVALKITTV